MTDDNAPYYPSENSPLLVILPFASRFKLSSPLVLTPVPPVLALTGSSQNCTSFYAPTSQQIFFKELKVFLFLTLDPAYGQILAYFEVYHVLTPRSNPI
jgi:hypothetical protein